MALAESIIVSRKELRREKVWEFEGQVRIKYYWDDNRGNIIPFETSSCKNRTLSGKFYIEEVEVEVVYKYTGPIKFVSKTLYRNGQEVDDDVYKYSCGQKSGTVSLVCGWG
jgi:hypothetical protein